MKPISFLAAILFFASCTPEPKPPVSEGKIISFYADYFILNEQFNQNLFKKDSLSAEDITKYALKKNKLTENDLKKINAFYEINPKLFTPILEKIEVKVDSIFASKK